MCVLVFTGFIQPKLEFSLKFLKESIFFRSMGAWVPLAQNKIKSIEENPLIYVADVEFQSINVVFIFCINNKDCINFAMSLEILNTIKNNYGMLWKTSLLIYNHRKKNDK